MKIAALLMLKNEEKRLHVTLQTLPNHVDALIIYDTGSTDNTISILRQFSADTNIPLHLLEGDFVDFATSRNVSLDFADEVAKKEKIDFFLLLDCNDELREGEALRKFCSKKRTKHSESAWLVNQQWYSGPYINYYNMRLIRALRGWRYHGVVHEWIATPEPHDKPLKVPDVVLFQDRTLDDDKTGKRFAKDRELLLAEHERDPDEPRTVFYLAQTCECLRLFDEALKYYTLRTTQVGFYEEVFLAHLRMGRICEGQNDWDRATMHYLNGFQFLPRAEPLVALGKHYKSLDHFPLAYMFLSQACKLDYPVECTLFVDKPLYEYERFHLLGIVAYYVNEHTEGLKACQQAIKVAQQEIDKKNMQFYMDVLFPKKKSRR
jgi:glycosyltransferase involved in cell wall biosynthesis